MTIERQGYRRHITFVCDGAHCHEVCETGTDDFNEARETMKAEGWVARKEIDDEWVHLCRDCR